MHKISIPIMADEKVDKYAVLEALKKADADYIFLSVDMIPFGKEDRDKKLEPLKTLIPFFKEQGFNVGVWLLALWFVDLPADLKEEYLMKNYKGELRSWSTPLNSNKEISSGFICPTSEKAVNIMTNYIKSITVLSPDIILFDDDLDFGTHMGSIGCYCDRHLKLISERLGYEISREELSHEVSSGKPNKVREEWLSLMGETLENYAKEIRKAVDSVNPEVRFGLCSVMS